MEPRESEPARRLHGLLARLAEQPIGDRPWLAQRFAVASCASVRLESDDHQTMAAAVAALPYGCTAQGEARWRVVVRRAISTEHSLAYAFAGAAVVPAGPGMSAQVLPTSDGVASWIETHATLLHAQPGRVTLRVYCASPAEASHWAARGLREAMTVQLSVDVAPVWARAAACVVRGVGVLIAGRPGSGTTTTLLTCLRLLGADFVADDRVLLRHVPDGLVGHPWPAALHLLPETAATFPGVGEHRQVPDVRPGRSQPVRIEPDRIGPLLHAGARVLDQVRPQLMLWPSLQLSTRGAPRPTWVRPEKVAAVLRVTRMFACDASAAPPRWQRFPGVVAPAPGPAAEQVAVNDVAARLARAVPTFSVPVTGNPRVLAGHVADLLTRAPRQPP